MATEDVPFNPEEQTPFSAANTMNDQSLDNPKFLQTEEVKMEEMRMARSWLSWKE